MKYFLILLLSLPLFATAQVTLPNKVAQFYYKEHIKAKILTEQVSVKDKHIEGLTKELDITQMLVRRHETDKMLYAKERALHVERIKSLEKDNRLLSKEVKKKKVQNVLVVTGAIVLATLSILSK